MISLIWVLLLACGEASNSSLPHPLEPEVNSTKSPPVPSLTKLLRWESRLQRRPKLQECLKWSLTATGTSTMAAFKNLLKLPAKVA